MTDDIVTRLRKYNIGNIAHESEFHMTEVLGEAADEIERLRADRDRWKKIAKERNPYSWVNLVRKKYGMEDMYER